MMQGLSIRKYFNSQPHEEADITPAMNSCQLSHFNSQPHEEADMMEQLNGKMFLHFNSQPHEEADGSTSNHLITGVQFQLTASRRG